MARFVVGSEDGLLTPDDVALILRCSRWCVYKLVQRGQLRAVRLGDGPSARIRVHGAEVARFLVEGPLPRPAEPGTPPRRTRPRRRRLREART